MKLGLGGVFAFATVSLVGSVKNVLLIVSDDLKADAIGCYGNPIARTPHIDQLAREGTLFKNAYCQGTWCAPSRASFMRGRYRGGEEITWGEHFQKHGYSSTRVGKIFHMRVPGDIIDGTDGQDVSACWSAKYNVPGKEAHTPGKYACLNLNRFTSELEGRESTRMPNRMFVTVEYEGDGSDQPDWKTATQSINLLKRFKQEKQPFFLAAGLIRPHYPNVAPSKYFDLYPPSKMKLPLVPSDDWQDMPNAGISKSNSMHFGIDRFPDNQRRMWTGYLATVTYMDEQVGRMLSALKELGLDKETLVLFTSDHGYLLGEHHFWQKGNLREEVTRVPLIIRSPGMKAGASSSIVELVDMFPTACELTGLPIPSSVQGKSLLSIMHNPSIKVRNSALSFVKQGTSMRSKRWSYMRYTDGSEELYDMAKDPRQFINLAQSIDASEQMSKARQAFDLRAQEIH